MVQDWNKLVNTINYYNSVSLDTKHMIIPEEMNKYNIYWENFNNAIIQAKKLKRINLYKCPPRVVETVIETLHQLEVLQALSIK